MSGECLIAADVDKTLLRQDESEERDHFVTVVAPQLVEAAAQGAHLAFITANAMEELTARLLTFLVEELCHTHKVHLLERFHFFSNAAGVYAHFASDNGPLTANTSLSQVLNLLLTRPNQRRDRVVRPEYIDVGYLQRTCIPEAEALAIAAVLEKVAGEYHAAVLAELPAIRDKYDVSAVKSKETLVRPSVEMRRIRFGSGARRSASVQITLKPVLSFRLAKNEKLKVSLFRRDLRTRYTKLIQQRLDESQLEHYVARPGGRSSIDVTLEKLDKAYALEFLVDRLNIQGTARKRQRFGTNAIYFGDEVLAGAGNDYAVSRIPGLMVFAVNPEKRLVPYLSRILVPSAILEGPDSTAKILMQFNELARERGKGQGTDAVLQELKTHIYSSRTLDRVERLKAKTAVESVEDWQMLHAFATLMSRRDAAAKGWLAILVDELDAIFSQVAASRGAVPPGLGTSHPDNKP